MAKTWTQAQKSKQAKRAAKLWQKRAASNPNSHPVAKARAKRDLTQRELAALAGMASQTVSEVENGKQVSSYIKDRLCLALAYPESELFPE